MEAKSAHHNGVPKGLILLTVIMGTFLGRLDQTIVNLALPKIIDDFHISVSAAGWIATAYILANAVFVPIWGKLGDTVGRKKVYLLGFGIFILGSVLAGLAWNLASMLLFRIIQAIASSADYPTAMAILTVTYPDAKERTRALGIWSSAFAASAVFGPLIGGPLIDDFSWRAVFLINLPVGLIGLLMAMAYIEESVSEKQTHSFDIPGALYLGTALSSLVLVLDRGQDWGWMSTGSLASYAAAVLSIIAFIWQENRHPEPLVDLHFFKNTIFVQTLLNNFIIFMGMMGSIFLLPIFAQTFMGYTATQSGYLFMPMAAGLMIAAPLGSKLINVMSGKMIIFWSTLVAGASLFLFIGLDPRSSALDVMLPMGLMAFGMGFGMGPRTNIIASVVPKTEIGVASSILALARNIAGAFGVAICATILNYAAESNVLKISELSSFNGTPAQQGTFITLIALKAQIDAYHTVFLFSATLVVIGAFALLFMRNVQLDKETAVHVE